MFANIILLIGMIILLCLVNPYVALFSILFLAGMYGSFYFLLRKKLGNIGYQVTETNERRFKHVNEIFSGIKILKALDVEKPFLKSFQSASKDFAKTQVKFETINVLPTYFAEPILFLALILFSLIMFIFNGGVGNYSIAELLPSLGVFAFAAYRIKPVIQNVYFGFTNLKYGKAHIENLYNDLIDRVNVKKKEKKILKTDFDSIRLNEVDFFWEENSQILSSINVTFYKGKVYGITGVTGSGKTTLIDIILGLLDPSAGNIYLEKMSKYSVEANSRSKLISYVPQETVIFDNSLKYNITFKDNLNKKEMALLNSTCMLSGLDDFVHKTIDGLETLLGENGARLSGGQKQRIGIARALFRDSPILVLDEATSALDDITEKLIIENLNTIKKDKLIIMIAHRKSSLDYADILYNLDGGKLIQIKKN